ncbi:ROK family protein [Sphaerisporangium sp. NPDC005288]|uniref:ROK family transcriptional regulator n=1 Tax=Sphaerisporangium sp. NPDC005288 TaxID=3155114 RepID=UPI0033A3BB9D
MTRGSVQERVRRDNLAALLRHVHLQGPATRAALAERLEVNRSTILTLSRELARAGLVREECAASLAPRAGRPSYVVRPNSAVHVLAFDVRPDGFTAARVRLGGRVLDRREVAAEIPSPAATREMARTLRHLAEAASKDGVCAGVGVSIPGHTSATDGGGAAYDDLLAGLRAAFRSAPRGGRSFAVGHEATLAVIAEHGHGVGKGYQNLVYLQGRDGLRGGVMVGGAPIGGEGGHGVDLGHLIVPPVERACGLGAGGCLPAGPCGGEEGRAARAVTAWPAKLLDLFAPEMIVFGDDLGTLYRSAAGWPEARQRHENSRSSPPGVRLARSALGGDAVLVGAAELAFSALLTDPIRVISEARK